MRPSLHRAGSVVGSALLLLTASLPLLNEARAETLVRAQGRCKLTSGAFEAFNGHCTFQHKAAGGQHSFVVHLNDGTDFVFSGPGPQALQVQTYRGITNVLHNEKPDHAVVSRWATAPSATGSSPAPAIAWRCAPPRAATSRHHLRRPAEVPLIRGC